MFHQVLRKATLAATLVLGMAGVAQAATLTIKNLAETITFGSLSYTGAVGDIQGYFNGAFSDTLAERFDSGNNPEESALVGGIIGDPDLDLGGTELPITGSSASIDGYTYFTAKFGQSVAVFYNTLATSITVTFAKSDTCKDQAPNNQCGGISHYKHVTVTPQVPLPAGLPLLALGLGALALVRRRKA